MRDWEELDLRRHKLAKELMNADTWLCDHLWRYFSLTERQIKKMKRELKKLNGKKNEK